MSTVQLHLNGRLLEAGSGMEIFLMGQNLTNLFFHMGNESPFGVSAPDTLDENLWYFCQILPLQNIAAKISLWWFCSYFIHQDHCQLHLRPLRSVFERERDSVHNGWGTLSLEQNLVTSGAWSLQGNLFTCTFSHRYTHRHHRQNTNQWWPHYFKATACNQLPAPPKHSGLVDISAAASEQVL